MKNFTVIKIEPGNIVLCDWCDKDWTDRPESGGFLLQSKAICPDCADKTLESLTHFNEEHLIRDRCPEGVSFADWVRSFR